MGAGGFGHMAYWVEGFRAWLCMGVPSRWWGVTPQIGACSLACHTTEREAVAASLVQQMGSGMGSLIQSGARKAAHIMWQVQCMVGAGANCPCSNISDKLRVL